MRDDDELLALALKASTNVSMTTLGALGGGPPLRYLWIPIVPVVVFAVALWMIGR